MYVISFDQNGEVLTAPDKNKEVMVQMGIMKMKVPMAELMLDDTPRPKEKPEKTEQPTKAKFSKSQFISAEIDCRGQLVDEAIANIDKYIDDAYYRTEAGCDYPWEGHRRTARRGAELSENEFSCKKLQTRYLRRRRSRCYGGGIKKGGFLNRGEEDGKTEDFGCG